jgi:predicted DNA-binding transcriptional regulator AlpA
MPVDDLVGVAEIASMFGITRQGVDKLIRTRADFPGPDATITAGRIWRRETIEKWAKATGREIVENG